jgi:multisubunit Na+/H+ antiporter MnhF subunit
VNAWLWGAAVLAAALVPLTIVALRGPTLAGIVALEIGGSATVMALLLIAEGTERQPFADLALVLAFVSYAGGLAFLRFVNRMRRA